MLRTLAPGKQRVTALKKPMFLTMESPMIKVIGGKSGRGGESGGAQYSCGAGVVDGKERLWRGPGMGWSGIGAGGGGDGTKTAESCRSHQIAEWTKSGTVWVEGGGGGHDGQEG